MLEEAVNMMSTLLPSGFYRALPCPPSSLFLFKKSQNSVVLSCFLSFGLSKLFSLKPPCSPITFLRRGGTFSFPHHRDFRRGHPHSLAPAQPDHKVRHLSFQMHSKERTRHLSHKWRTWVAAGAEDDHDQRDHHSPVFLCGPTLQHPQQHLSQAPQQPRGHQDAWFLHPQAATCESKWCTCVHCGTLLISAAWSPLVHHRKVWAPHSSTSYDRAKEKGCTTAKSVGWSTWDCSAKSAPRDCSGTVGAQHLAGLDAEQLWTWVLCRHDVTLGTFLTPWHDSLKCSGFFPPDLLCLCTRKQTWIFRSVISVAHAVIPTTLVSSLTQTHLLHDCLYSSNICNSAESTHSISLQNTVNFVDAEAPFHFTSLNSIASS